MMPATSREAILAQSVFCRGRNLPFGELSVDDVADRGRELREAVGWGPTARVAGVARSWRELGMVMEREGAAHVADLSEARLQELAPRLWIIPPGGGLLG
jgi:hypothetical protein